MDNKQVRNFFVYVFLVLALVYLFSSGIVTRPTYREIPFGQFIRDVEKGKVAKATLHEGKNLVEADYRDGSHRKASVPSDFNLSETLIRNKVEVQVKTSSYFWFSLLINWLPVILLAALMFFMIQQMQGSGSKIFSFGKSRARKMVRDYPKVSFKDVAGLNEAIEELKEIKEYLVNPTKFQNMGARVPKGILLYGPPGCGKTLLARAVAGEAKVPFFSISGSEFVEMFVGVGASRVRDLFEQAKAHAPAIVFIDEIDAVGRHRGAGLGGGHDEREQTLNQLLVEMDGFDVNDNLIVMAATNRPDILDPALLRPGRFDRHIAVDAPDLQGRVAILKVHTKGKPLAKDVNLEILARRTPGFTGADLANMVNEAAILAARNGKKLIGMKEMEEGVERIVAGPEKKTKVISEKEKAIIAYHEIGHALVAHMLPEANPVHKISIIPRGRALGYTLTLPIEDRYLVTRSELMDQLTVLLGGRVAEELVFKDVTTGDQDDLEKATKIARKMVCEYGMSDKLGPITLGQKQDQVFLGRDFSREPNYSQEIAFEIDKEVRRIVDECYARAEKILVDNRERLDLIARYLIDRESLDGQELEELLEKGYLEEKEVAEEPPAEVGKETPSEVKPGLKPVPGGLRPAEG